MLDFNSNDPRSVMTLDAGGTNMVFSALRGGRALTEPLTLDSRADSLENCLGQIVRGFTLIRERLPQPPVAISFAFPGPADYPAGIIGDLANLPAFRGGVALGPYLENHFKIPVFINNDGDLFTYGEALSGFLPEVNAALKKNGSPKRYKNILGLTLGTGLGGGIVSDGNLFLGDNSIAGEAWLLRHKLDPQMNAEEGCSIRAVRKIYALESGIPFTATPEPKIIHQIALGLAPGNRVAAIESFRRMGEVAGDVVAQALTLIDGLVVIGGGLSGAHELFLPSLVTAANASFENTQPPLRRLVSRVYNFEDISSRNLFIKGDPRTIGIPGSTRQLRYDATPRIAVGISRLGTSEAVAIGAYAFALRRLD